MIRVKVNPTEVAGVALGNASQFSKAREWSKLIAITGAAQVVVQLIGFVCGILVIRLLPVQEYAYYTIANTTLGTMTLLADGGIASGVMSQGGKVWQDRKKLGAVLATGMKLRRQFAVWSLTVSIPMLYLLLMKQGATSLTATMIAISLLPAFLSVLSGALLEISVKLHQDITALQVIQVSRNALRLALSGLMLFVFPFAAFAVVASGTAQIYSNLRLRKVSKRFADSEVPTDPLVQKEMLSIVRRVMPGTIYFSLSGQLTIWLISIFGKTESIAHVGALGRLTQVFVIVSSLFAMLLVPRYARLPSNPRTVLKRFLQIECLLVGISAAIVASVAMSPELLLTILGEEYRSLSKELMLIVIGSSCSMVAGCTFSLNVSRGRIVPPFFAIPYSIAFQLAAILTQDLTTTCGVLKVAIITAVAQCALNSSYALGTAREP